MDNAIYGSAKAWVNINGVSGASPVIRGSYNTSSVTRNGTGQYTMNFTNALSDTNFAVITSARATSAATSSYPTPDITLTTSSISLVSVTTSGSLVDANYYYAAVFR